MLTSEIIGAWIQYIVMQMVFKNQVNQMKIDNFRNLANVDLLTYVDLLADIDLKNNRWLNSMTWYAKPLQISSQMDENWQF